MTGSTNPRTPALRLDNLATEVPAFSQDMSVELTAFEQKRKPN